jgi:hypothetical protein
MNIDSKNESNTTTIELVSKATEEIFADTIGRDKRTYWVYADDSGNTEFRQT